MKKIIIVGVIISFFCSCETIKTTIISERVEYNILNVSIESFREGSDNGFQKVSIKIKNNSNEDLEFSAQSFFEDKLGRYRMIYLPSMLYAGTARTVQLRRTSYREEGSVSFGFTGNFWGISGFELDSGSHWRVSDSDLNVNDIYVTLIFKIKEKIYQNTYHLERNSENKHSTSHNTR